MDGGNTEQKQDKKCLRLRRRDNNKYALEVRSGIVANRIEFVNSSIKVSF